MPLTYIILNQHTKKILQNDSNDNNDEGDNDGDGSNGTDKNVDYGDDGNND